MPKSYYADNITLGTFLTNTPFTPPITVWLALFLVAPPTPAGGGTEVSGNGYARQIIAFSTPNNGMCSNSAAITFPVDMVADWTTVVAFGVYDASSGGNLLYYANLSTSRYVAVNDQIVFPVGQLIAQET
jgi:hypothetical protein